MPSTRVTFNLEVRCLGCDTNQTGALDIMRRPKSTPVHELERYMRAGIAQKCAVTRTSEAIWLRCGGPRFRRAIRRRTGGRGRDEDADDPQSSCLVNHSGPIFFGSIVTGIDADKKSNAILNSKIALAPAPNDLKWAHLWVTESYPLSISATDTKDNSVGVSPPENGTQFGVVEIPPSDPVQSAQPLWHRTRTVDYVVVMSGEIDLMLEASVVHLQAGDTVVQQATNHAWINRGTVPCRLLFVLMDAKRPNG
jgi:hypothetical protein